jgi:hydantoinase/carbamoylase family amidase
MREVMEACGFDPRQLAEAAYRRAAVLGFVEVHIEQGPVLLNDGLPLGIVTAIAGATRFLVEVEGLAGHAGTVPMDLRRDAAMAAAEMALHIEQRCRAQPGLVGTVGMLTVPDGAVNVVPGKANFSIDIRAEQDAVRLQAVADVLRHIEAVARRRRVTARIRKVHEASSVPCAPRLQQQLAAALKHCGLPIRHLPSGAGHDAMAMAAMTDAAMLFVRCGNGGISHHPDEIMTQEDAALAAQVFIDFVEHFLIANRVEKE